jgi:hypothetical protein
MTKSALVLEPSGEDPVSAGAPLVDDSPWATPVVELEDPVGPPTVVLESVPVVAGSCAQARTPTTTASQEDLDAIRRSGDALGSSSAGNPLRSASTTTVKQMLLAILGNHRTARSGASGATCRSMPRQSACF